MALWEDVAASQYAANSLLLPAFSLRMLSRDWSLMSTSFDWSVDVGSKGAPPGSVNAWRASLAIVRVRWPDNWGYDATFDVDLSLRLSLRIEARYTAGTPSLIRIAEFSGSTGQQVGVLSPDWEYFTPYIDYNVGDGDTLPTGVVTYYLEFFGGDGDAIEYRKTIHDEGPNSWFGFLLA